MPALPLKSVNGQAKYSEIHEMSLFSRSFNAITLLIPTMQVLVMSAVVASDSDDDTYGHQMPDTSSFCLAANCKPKIIYNGKHKRIRSNAMFEARILRYKS